MEQKPIHVDGEVLWMGIRRAASRSEEPLLCLVKPEAIQFVALSGLRLVVSWETALERPAPGGMAIVIPPTIAEFLSCEIVRSQSSVTIMSQGSDVILRLADQLGSYELGWKSDLAAFPAPDEFSDLIKVPDALVEVPYISISDAAHQAVAKLVRIESESEIDRVRLAILIALDFGRLSLNGNEILGTGSSEHYFDPRLVIRALEFVKEQRVRVGITPLRGGRRAYLSLLTQKDIWSIHCALLSIGRETQKLYPLPEGRNR